MQAKKTSSKNATIEIGADFPFDEASNRGSLLDRLGEKSLEALSDNFVEKRLLWLVALVARLIDDHMDPVRDRVGECGQV